jgi:ABC-2 type transport system ATP-binding protein
MSDLIVVDSLKKRYKNREAVKGISFAIQQGVIFGFIGPNGAGKTTTIRILTTLLAPSSGTVLVNGHDVVRDKMAVRRALGYVPDFFGTYNEMTVQEYLDFFAGCYDIPHADRPALLTDLLALVDLSHRRADFVESLSRGMKQRLGLARALIHDPQILILDEPASGLDPRARVEFRVLLKELQRLGKTIFFSSHILADVDELCTDIGIIEAGQIVAFGNLRALRAELRATRKINLTILGQDNTTSLDAARVIISQLEGVTDLTYQTTIHQDWELEFHYSGDKPAVVALVKKLVQADIPLLSLQEEAETLEDMFMNLTEGIVS